MMVLSAASSTTSASPDALFRPIGWLRVEQQFDMQSMMAHQHRTRLGGPGPSKPANCARNPQARVLVPSAIRTASTPPSHSVAGDVRRARPAASGAIRSSSNAAPAHHFRGSLLIEAASACERAPRRRRPSGAVQRVVQAAPARIRRIQRIACVGDRNHELRSGQDRDLVVDVRGIDAETVQARPRGSRSGAAARSRPRDRARPLPAPRDSGRARPATGRARPTDRAAAVTARTAATRSRSRRRQARCRFRAAPRSPRNRQARMPPIGPALSAVASGPV